MHLVWTLLLSTGQLISEIMIVLYSVITYPNEISQNYYNTILVIFNKYLMLVIAEAVQL